MPAEMAPEFAYNLPAELSLQIMLELPSPREVHALTRVSKVFSEIYKRYKMQIQSAILQNWLATNEPVSTASGMELHEFEYGSLHVFGLLQLPRTRLPKPPLDD
jgi:hypothetical protein